jgi:hypothetical protein
MCRVSHHDVLILAFWWREPLPVTCRTDILRVLSILDAGGWNCFANLSCSSVGVILTFLAGASDPADEVSVLSTEPDCIV